MRVSKYYLEEGERIPFGYGVAYYDVPRAQVVCYPIPFNLLANLARKIYWRIKCPSLAKQERLIDQAFIRGRTQGYRAMRKRFQEVYEEWKKERKRR